MVKGCDGLRVMVIGILGNKKDIVRYGVSRRERFTTPAPWRL